MSYRTRYSGGGASAGAVWPRVDARTENPLAYAGATALASANDTVYSRVIAGFTLNASAIRLAVQSTSGNICVAVYADNNGAPGARLATSGSVAAPSNGWASVALGTTVNVSPGMWLSISADNTTITFGRSGVPAGTGTFGPGVQARQTSAFPAPSSAAATETWRAGYILIAE